MSDNVIVKGLVRGDICVLREVNGKGNWHALKILDSNPTEWIGCFSYLG